MKRCPQCNRVETDEALSLPGDAGTGQLAADASEVHTSILPHRTDANINRATAATTVLPAQQSGTTNALTRPKRRWITIAVVIGAVAVFVAFSVVVVGFYLSRPRRESIQSIAVLPL